MTPPTQSSRGIRQVMDERAACEDCTWEGETREQARRHHVATGHNCHATLRLNFYYGDPLASFMRNQGITRV